MTRTSQSELALGTFLPLSHSVSSPSLRLSDSPCRCCGLFISDICPRALYRSCLDLCSLIIEFKVRAHILLSLPLFLRSPAVPSLPPSLISALYCRAPPPQPPSESSQVCVSRLLSLLTIRWHVYLRVRGLTYVTLRERAPPSFLRIPRASRAFLHWASGP